MTPIIPDKLKVGKLYAQYSDAKGLGRIKYFKVVRVLEPPCTPIVSDDRYPYVKCRCIIIQGMTTKMVGGIIKRDNMDLTRNNDGQSTHTFSFNSDVFELNEKETLNILAQTI